MTPTLLLYAVSAALTYTPAPAMRDASEATVRATGSTTARTHAQRAADTVNVKDFGAVGDGVTDDTAALQAALDSATLGAGAAYTDRTKGYRVALRNGTYIASGFAYDWHGQGVQIHGDSLASIVKQKANTSGDLFTFSGVVPHFISKVALRNMRIDGNQSQQTTENRGAYFHNAYAVEMENVEVVSNKGNAIHLDGVNFFTYRGGTAGFGGDDPGLTDNMGHGFYITNTHDAWIRDAIVQVTSQPGKYGVYIDDPGAGRYSTIKLEHVHFELNANNLYIYNPNPENEVVVDGCKFLAIIAPGYNVRVVAGSYNVHFRNTIMPAGAYDDAYVVEAGTHNITFENVYGRIDDQSGQARVVSATKTSYNFATNGGFETGDLTGWTASGTGTATVQGTTTHFSPYAARVVNAAGQSTFLDVAFSVAQVAQAKGNDVTVSGFGRTDAPALQQGRWTVTIVAGGTTYVSGGALAVADTWEFQPLTFSVPTNATAITVRYQTTESTTTYLDDVSIVIGGQARQYRYENPTLTPLAGNGANGYLSVTGARLKLGSGTNDYLYSDGTRITTPGDVMALGHVYGNQFLSPVPGDTAYALVTGRANNVAGAIGVRLQAGTTLTAPDAAIAVFTNSTYDVAAVDRSGGIVPGQMNLGGITASAHIYSGTGAPSDTYGANGDFYLRSDTPGTANQRLYVKNSGTWTGIL